MNRIKVRRPDVVLRPIRVAKVFLLFFLLPPPRPSTVSSPSTLSLVITISVMADPGPAAVFRYTRGVAGEFAGTADNTPPSSSGNGCPVKLKWQTVIY